MLPLLLCERTVFIIAGNMCSKDLDKQYTLNIVFLFCTALFFILMYLSQMQYIFLPCTVYKTKMLLKVFHCHTILIENICRLSWKSMLPTMFIKICVKLKHIHLASYVEAEKLTSKVNASLWQTYIMSKISLKLCKFSPLNSLESDLGKIIEPCSSFLAKVKEIQRAWVPKSQGQSRNFVKKTGRKP